MPIQCPHCATSNRDEARFCRECGRWLLPACPHCGVALPGASVFCDRCGYQVSPLPASGRQWLELRSAVDPAPVGPPTPVPETPSVQPLAPSQPRTRPALGAGGAGAPPQAFIPRELAAKLEAARAAGEMVGERRIVTMLFCDVTGSTAAAEQLDPEDWTEIMNGAFELMIRPVYQYEGTLARLMGDALLAFFGAPIAHEDDPQRAVLAGLDIVAAVRAYRERIQRRWGFDFNVRVGINTGLVVVGAVGSDLRLEYSALGDAINLAARMEQTAAPGTVRIAYDTYKLVKPLFEFEPLGGIEVKGKSEPVLAYRVLGRKAEAAGTRGIEGLHVDLVGREAELRALRGVMAGLQQGLGRIVCVLGEAGLGKSRLVAESRQHFAGQAGVRGRWHEAGSLSYEAHQAYGLFQRLLRRAEGLAYDEAAAAVRAKLQPLVAALPEARQARGLQALAALLGLPPEADEPPLAGESFRDDLVEALRAWWRARFAAQPTVLVFDDMHWADAASVALLRQLLPLTDSLPLALVCVLRPERQSPAWQIKTAADQDLHHRYTELALRPLSDAESDELVNRLLAVAELPDPLRAAILEKAGGNPFFIEEVVRSLIESGVVAAEDRRENGATRRYWRATRPAGDIVIPDNLQSLLAARMDRLDDDTRQTLQLASVIGRSFYYRVLAGLAAAEAGSAADIDRHLSALVHMEMIQEAARVPEVEYRFNNPLMQEATYRTILLKRRREFHRRVGGTMEALYPERLAELAPRLAHHFAEGGDAAQALKYFTLAGDNALRLYASREAVAHYDRALELAEAAGAGDAEQLRLFTGKGRALELSSQFADALAVYQRLEALGLQRGSRPLELAALVAQGTIYSTANDQLDPAKAQALAERGLAMAQALGDRASEAKILWNLLNIWRYIGRMLEARAAGERSLALAQELGLREHAAFVQNDLFYVYLGVGDAAAAYATNRRAREQWRALGNRAMLADNLSASVILSVFMGDFDEAIASSDEALAISQSIDNAWGLAFSRMNVGTAYWARGDFGQAIRTIHDALTGAERAGFMVGQVWPAIELGMLYSWLGQPERGLALAGPAHETLVSRSTVSLITSGFLVHVYVDLGRLDEAQALIDRGLQADDSDSIQRLLLRWVRHRLLIARGDYSAVTASVAQALPDLRTHGIKLLIPDTLLALGQAQAALGDLDAARSALIEARAAAEAIDHRWSLWQILAALAQLEQQAGDGAAAQALREQARLIALHVADHAGADDLRASFLARPDVRDLL